MTGRFDLPLEEFFSRPSVDTLRSHRLKLYHRRFRLNRRGATFSVRIVNNWNKLPPFLMIRPLRLLLLRKTLIGRGQLIFLAPLKVNLHLLVSKIP